MKSKTNSVKACLTLPLFLFLTLAGCVNNPDPVVTIPIITGPWQEINIGKLLENTTVQPLSTTTDCLVGKNFFFLDYTDEFYILDKSVEKIYRFGSNGDFLNSIGKTGKGPEEYQNLVDGIITSTGIELLSGAYKMFIHSYQADGTYLGKRQVLNNRCFSFILSPGLNSYFFYGGNNYNKIIQTDRSTGEKTDSLLKVVAGTQAFSFLTFSSSGGKSVLFCEPVINKVYEITSSGIMEKYRLDFFYSRGLGLQASDNPVVINLSINNIITN